MIALRQAVLDLRVLRATLPDAAGCRVHLFEDEFDALRKLAESSMTDASYTLSATAAGDDNNTMNDDLIEAAKAAWAAEVAWSRAACTSPGPEPTWEGLAMTSRGRYIAIAHAVVEHVRMTEVAPLKRELHRWQCGRQIEGDYVCEAALRAEETARKAERRRISNAVRAQLADCLASLKLHGVGARHARLLGMHDALCTALSEIEGI